LLVEGIFSCLSGGGGSIIVNFFGGVIVYFFCGFVSSSTSSAASSPSAVAASSDSCMHSVDHLFANGFVAVKEGAKNRHSAEPGVCMNLQPEVG
jgi:hypothetical protein